MGVVEGDIKLALTPFTHLNEFRKLYCEALSIDNWEMRQAFKSVSDKQIKKLLEEYSIVSPSGGLIIFKPGVFHFERRLRIRDNIQFIGSSERYRYVVGTQKLIGLDKNQTKRLALLAISDLCPAIYSRPNRKCAPCVHKNTVNLKTTRWHKWRNQSVEEKEILYQKVISIKNLTQYQLDNEIATLSPIIQLLYGIETELSDQLGFTQMDLNLIKLGTHRS